MGFSNPIVGGGGGLVYPSIHSPNFNVTTPLSSPSPSWGILKSGLAYFFGLTLLGGSFTGTNYVINSSGTFFYSGTPAAGNLVATITPTSGTDTYGNAYLQGVTSYQPPGPFATATNLNGGLVSWFEAATQVGPYTNYADIGFSFTSPNLGTLNLQANNLVQIGQSAKLTWDDVHSILTANGAIALPPVSTPSTPGANSELYGASNNSGTSALKSIDTNGSLWQVGSNTFYTPGTQQFTLGADTAITGLSASLGAGIYRLFLRIWYTPSGVIGSSHQHKWAFTGSGSIRQNAVCWQSTATSTATDHSMVQNNTTFPGLIIQSPTHANFAAFMECDAILTVTGAGTLTTTVNLATPGDDITTAQGCYLEVTPLP